MQFKVNIISAESEGGRQFNTKQEILKQNGFVNGQVCIRNKLWGSNFQRYKTGNMALKSFRLYIGGGSETPQLLDG